MLVLEDRCLWHCPVHLLTYLILFKSHFHLLLNPERLGSGGIDFQYWGSYSSNTILLAGIYDEDPGRVPWVCHS